MKTTEKGGNLIIEELTALQEEEEKQQEAAEKEEEEEKQEEEKQEEAAEKEAAEKKWITEFKESIEKIVNISELETKKKELLGQLGGTEGLIKATLKKLLPSKSKISKKVTPGNDDDDDENNAKVEATKKTANQSTRLEQETGKLDHTTEADIRKKIRIIAHEIRMRGKKEKWNQKTTPEIQKKINKLVREVFTNQYNEDQNKVSETVDYLYTLDKILEGKEENKKQEKLKEKDLETIERDIMQANEAISELKEKDQDQETGTLNPLVQRELERLEKELALLENEKNEKNEKKEKKPDLSLLKEASSANQREQTTTASDTEESNSIDFTDTDRGKNITKQHSKNSKPIVPSQRPKPSR